MVVGGGVIGCALAYELASRGSRVLVLERERLAAGASAGAGGMLAPQVEARGPGPLLELGLRSRAMFPQWCAGLEVGLELSGILRVTCDEAGVAELRVRARWQGERGLEARLCDAAECARLCPGLAPALLGLWVPDGQVDAPRLTLALGQAAVRAGARVREGVVVTAIHDGAVDTDEGRVAADAVVVATGAWSGLLAGVPVRPVKGQRLMLRHPGWAPPLVVWSDGCYLVPKSGGRVLVGATEEAHAGFDRTVTAGAVAALATAAARAAPPLAAAELAEAWAGLRPCTPDHLPLLGRLPGTSRTWLATGHHRNGILLAPLTARLLGEAILCGAPIPAACAPERFMLEGEGTGERGEGDGAGARSVS